MTSILHGDIARGARYPLWITLFIQQVIHGHFVTAFTATLSHFGLKTHGHFVTPLYLLPIVKNL
jgi:hypothetical protein